MCCQSVEAVHGYCGVTDGSFRGASLNLRRDCGNYFGAYYLLKLHLEKSLFYLNLVVGCFLCFANANLLKSQTFRSLYFSSSCEIFTVKLALSYSEAFKQLLSCIPKNLVEETIGTISP